MFGENALVAEWVSQRITSINADFKNCVAIGVTKNGKLIAGVVYHNYFPDFKNIELSMAADSPMWATKDIIKALLQYPFIQLGCKRITTCTSARNKRALKFNYGIGFRREGVIRRGYGNHDMIICGMLRKEAERWLKTEKEEVNGQENTKSTAGA